MARPAASFPQQLGPAPLTGNVSSGPDLREVWFSLMRFRWTSLGVVSADAYTSALPVAKGLADVGSLFRGRPVTLIDTAGLDLNGTAQVVEQLMMAGGDPGAPARVGSSQIVVALSNVANNSMVIPLAMSVDACVVLVEEGVTKLDDLKHTLDTVGRDRVLGTVFVRRQS